MSYDLKVFKVFMSKIVDQHFASFFRSIPLTKTLNTYNSKTTTPNFDFYVLKYYIK